MEKKKGKIVEMSELGKCSVYVMHSRGFNGTLRPSHDTSPHAHAWITQEQAVELTGLIQAKLLNFAHKNGGGTFGV